MGSNNINFFLIGIHPLQGRTATTKAWSYKKKKHKKIKRLKHTGNLFRKNLQLIGVCYF